MINIETLKNIKNLPKERLELKKRRGSQSNPGPSLRTMTDSMDYGNVGREEGWWILNVQSQYRKMVFLYLILCVWWADDVLKFEIDKIGS